MKKHAFFYCVNGGWFFDQASEMEEKQFQEYHPVDILDHLSEEGWDLLTCMPHRFPDDQTTYILVRKIEYKQHQTDDD